MKLSPDDLLWLAIIEEEQKLAYMSDKAVKRNLKRRNLPDRIIDAYLKRRAVLFEE